MTGSFTPVLKTWCYRPDSTGQLLLAANAMANRSNGLTEYLCGLHAQCFDVDGANQKPKINPSEASDLPYSILRFSTASSFHGVFVGNGHPVKLESTPGLSSRELL